MSLVRLAKHDGLRDDRRMKTSRRKAKVGQVSIRGRRVPAFGRELVVVRTGQFSGQRKVRKSSEEAGALVRKAGKALKQPGIRTKAVFKGRHQGVFAYSVDPGDPRKIVRRSVAGKRTIGRLADGRFKAY